MTVVLKALLIDGSMTIALEELEASLRPEIEFEYLDSVNTVHKAIQYHMDMDFQLCFIGDKFPPGEVTSFFSDFKKLQKGEGCVFVQLRDQVSASFDQRSLVSLGFNAVVSKKGTAEDKKVLDEVLQPFILQVEYQEIKSGLTNIVENLMREIDKVALERKRGKDIPLNSIYADHLRSSSEKFSQLQEDYLEKLVDRVEKAVPFSSPKLEIPETITKKNLPHLSRTTYAGQSHRVFDKLLKMHGKKGSDKDSEESSD